MQTRGGSGWTSAWKKNYSYHICEIYSDNLAVCLYILFPDIDFGTLAFLFGQPCLCVTFTAWSTPSLGMLVGTHKCVHPVSE